MSTIVVAGLLAGCADTKEYTFASMSMPEAQSMVTRGWIPAVLPTTATGVRFRGNIDTGLVRGEARLGDAELRRFRESLRPLGGDVVAPFWTKGSVNPSWWPEELFPPGRASELRARGWELFEVPDAKTTYVALRAAEGAVFFWTEHS